MSILDDLIALARRKQQDKQRKEMERDAKAVQRIIGKDLYKHLDIHPNEYLGLLEFTARNRTFVIDSPMRGWGMYVTPKEQVGTRFFNCRFVTSADDLLLYIDKYTKPQPPKPIDYGWGTTQSPK